MPCPVGIHTTGSEIVIEMREESDPVPDADALTPTPEPMTMDRLRAARVKRGSRDCIDTTRASIRNSGPNHELHRLVTTALSPLLQARRDATREKRGRGRLEIAVRVEGQVGRERGCRRSQGKPKPCLALASASLDAQKLKLISETARSAPQWLDSGNAGRALLEADWGPDLVMLRNCERRTRNREMRLETCARHFVHALLVRRYLARLASSVRDGACETMRARRATCGAGLGGERLDWGRRILDGHPCGQWQRLARGDCHGASRHPGSVTTAVEVAFHVAIGGQQRKVSRGQARVFTRNARPGTDTITKWGCTVDS